MINFKDEIEKYDEKLLIDDVAKDIERDRDEDILDILSYIKKNVKN